VLADGKDLRDRDRARDWRYLAVFASLPLPCLSRVAALLEEDCSSASGSAGVARDPSAIGTDPIPRDNDSGTQRGVTEEVDDVRRHVADVRRL